MIIHEGHEGHQEDIASASIPGVNESGASGELYSNIKSLFDRLRKIGLYRSKPVIEPPLAN